MIKSFLSAIQFLTIIPLRLKNINEKTMANAMIFFPVIGLFLGLSLCGVYKILILFNFSSFLSSIILIMVLVMITGGMHLDGLSDTADAFLSCRPKEKMLEIMRDPHIGVMGVLSLICAIFLKIGLLSSLAPEKALTALILMCILSRWSCVLAMFLFPYARNEGKAKVFTSGINLKIFLISTVIVFVSIFFIWQTKAIAALLTVAGFTYLIGRLSVKKINGITGDVLGAVIESTEVIALFVFAMK